jgi:hypothetical protein
VLDLSARRMTSVQLCLNCSSIMCLSETRFSFHHPINLV